MVVADRVRGRRLQRSQAGCWQIQRLSCRTVQVLAEVSVERDKNLQKMLDCEPNRYFCQNPRQTEHRFQKQQTQTSVCQLTEDNFTSWCHSDVHLLPTVNVIDLVFAEPVEPDPLLFAQVIRDSRSENNSKPCILNLELLHGLHWPLFNAIVQLRGEVHLVLEHDRS